MTSFDILMKIKAPNESFIFLFIVLLIHNILFAGDNDGKYKVAVFPLEPFIFQNEQGLADGMFVELLEAIADTEEWELEYVYGTWADGLNWIKDGTVDVVTNAAYSEDRDKFMDYPEESVYGFWTQVYAPGGVSLHSIHQLEGKKVALMQSDINSKHFIKKMSELGLSFTPYLVDSFDEVFQLLEINKVDAGVTNSSWGYRFEKSYNISRTSISIEPFGSYFVVAEGKNPIFLSKSSQILKKLKDDNDSFYYRMEDKWVLGRSFKTFPTWLLKVLVAAALIIIISISFILYLKYRIKKATAETDRLNRKLQQQALNYLEAKERLELAIKIGNLSICECNWTKDTFYTDDRLMEMLGSSESKHIHQSLWDLWDEIVIHDDKKEVFELLQQLIENKRTSFDVIFRMENHSKEIKWLRAIVEAVKSKETGKTIRLLAIHADISELKKRELEAEQFYTQRLTTDKLTTLGTLAAGIAHEINNPNQFITSNLAFLEATWPAIREILDEYCQSNPTEDIAGFDQKEYAESYSKALNSIKSGSRRIKTIVKELKDYVRDNRTETFSDVDINKILYSAQILTASIGKKSTHTFEWKTEDNLFVRGNAQRLEQVFVNLIINAFEALTDKSQSVLVKSFKDNLNGIVIQIKDEGQGIPDEYMSRLTDPFFTTKQTSGGTGMGLSVANSIIKEHCGELVFESSRENGTCAKVIIPALNLQQ